MLHIFPSSQSFADWINKLFVCHIIRFSDSIQWVNVDNNFITIIVTPGKWIVDPVWNAILMKWFDFQQQIFMEFIFSIHRVALRFTFYALLSQHILRYYKKKNEKRYVWYRTTYIVQYTYWAKRKSNILYINEKVIIEILLLLWEAGQVGKAHNNWWIFKSL